MPGEVLQYDSLKTVLRYMNPNLRLCLSQRIPAIRFAEKAVPLKINYLEFTDLGVTVNDTTYNLSVYRDFHQGEEVADQFQRENYKGGVLCDLDQYGFRVPINRSDVLPGEIVFGEVINENRNFRPNLLPFFPWTHQQNNEITRRYYEKHLEIYQLALTRRLERLQNGEEEPIPVRVRRLMRPVFTDDELHRMNGSVLQELAAEELELKLAILNDKSTWSLEKEITRLRYSFQPFDCLYNNRPLPFTPLIQLTMEREDQEKRIERYPYTMKLHEAMRKLNRMMFGGRTSIVHVQKISFNFESMVLRIPEGLKIRVGKLKFSENVNARLEALNNLIDQSSYPLQSLMISAGVGEVDHFVHPILTNAKCVYLEGWRPEELTPLLNLRNEYVLFNYSRTHRFTTVRLFAFVQNTLTAEYPVGTCRLFRILREQYIKDLLNQVEEQFNAMKTENRATIPMRNGCNLVVSYKANSDQWILSMEVVSV
ncbi:hypothetical protein CRE_22624 [Caenorhabditis remanei]|uniref:Uncharacterized protein n=1 Tax=Caenorhabditis remanei TaxID=31234 RepID=E3N8S9_CAERE|nr:hypothetical protein CRE_22624 [Caenorhabditis remanei]